MKERLTGAILLVALIVLLVPEMLRGPIRPAAQARGNESAEEAPLKSVTISLSDDTHVGSAALQPQTPTPVAPAADPRGSAPQPPPAAATSTPPAHPGGAPPTQAASPQPSGAPQAPPPAVSRGGGLVVQLGSFASRANAERLAAQVRTRGFQVSVSRSSRGKRLYRVQVGPAHDHAAAEQLLGRLRATGHSGPIVPQ